MNTQLIRELASLASESEVWKSHREYAESRGVHILLPESAALLRTIVRMVKPKNILEIGTAIGYSGSLMLEASDAVLTTIELDEPTLNTAINYFCKHNVQNRVKTILGDAASVVLKLCEREERFDLIFLDSAKSKYIDLLPSLLTLLDSGGTLVADNVLFKGYISGENTPPKHGKHNTIIRKMNMFLREISANPMLSTTVLNIADGVSISVKIK